MKRILAVVGAVLVFLMLTVVGFVALHWAPDRPVDALTARWAQPPSRFVEVSGMQVHLRDEGPREDSTPIVLLHGTSASLHTWDGWTDGLRNERRVIRFDLPGFGLTGPFPNGDYSIGHYTQFVVSLLDTIGVERAVLAGNSLGGQIAWEVAVLSPERVEKLVLIDAAGYPFERSSMPIGFRLAQMPVVNRVMENVLPRSMIESSVRDVYGDPTKVTPALVERYYELTLRAGNRAALVERFRQAQSGPGHERIATIRTPTLILWGGRDRLIPPEHGERFAQDLPNAELITFDALRHVPHEEDPAGTLAAVRSFL